MDDEDFQVLVRVVRDQLDAVGISEIGNLDHYLEEDDGEARLPNARELVIELLRAFERHVSVQDRATYDKAMETIRSAITEGARPVEATLELDSDTSRLLGVPARLSLSRSPDLSAVRDLTRNLIIELGGTHGEDRDPEAEQ